MLGSHESLVSPVIAPKVAANGWRTGAAGILHADMKFERQKWS